MEPFWIIFVCSWRFAKNSLLWLSYPLQIAVSGKSFNHSARDAWELFQSTGVEALVAYDCSGAVLLMGTLLGGLITGTCSGVWTWFKWNDRVMMVGTTAMLMGMVLVSYSLRRSFFFVVMIFECFSNFAYSNASDKVTRRWVWFQTFSTNNMTSV